MRKKSHISLAKFLMNNMKVQDLYEHKNSFYIGSVLPDLKPSFLTRRHTIDDTFEVLIKEIKKITVNYDINKGINRYYARHLGVVTHYLSDYCTYPHNSVFDGTIKEHISYERELKCTLKEYIVREDIQRERKQCQMLHLDDVLAFILLTHKEYLRALKDVNQDIHFIIDICYKVVDAILRFFEIAMFQLQINVDSEQMELEQA